MFSFPLTHAAMNCAERKVPIHDLEMRHQDVKVLEHPVRLRRALALKVRVLDERQLPMDRTHDVIVVWIHRDVERRHRTSRCANDAPRRNDSNGVNRA